jgi:hypothetical protein
MTLKFIAMRNFIRECGSKYMTRERRAAEFSAWCRKISIRFEHPQGLGKNPD